MNNLIKFFKEKNLIIYYIRDKLKEQE